MAGTPIPAERLAAFLAAYQDAMREGCAAIGVPVGSGMFAATAEAARRLQMSRAQMTGCVDRLKADGAFTPARDPGFTAPVLPVAHEPVDDMIERRIAAYERKRDASKAREWMKFEIHEGAPFALAFVGDPHADDDGSHV